MVDYFVKYFGCFLFFYVKDMDVVGVFIEVGFGMIDFVEFFV